jgi:pyruvate kinase
MRADSMDGQISLVVQAAVDSGLVKSCDLVIITAGFPLHTSGSTNMLKVHFIEADHCPSS